EPLGVLRGNNAFDQVVTQTTALGTTTNTFDRLGRLRKVVQPPVGSGTGHDTSFKYDAVGNRIAVLDHVVGRYKNPYTQQQGDYQHTDETSYAYDPLNRLVQITDPTGNASDQPVPAVRGITRQEVDQLGRAEPGTSPCLAAGVSRRTI